LEDLKIQHKHAARVLSSLTVIYWVIDIGLLLLPENN